MQLWTTFAPQKISWEITTIRQNGKKGTSKWMENQDIIESSLRLLRQSGVSGIRLVIFPSEVTSDGKRFDWTPIDTMLDLCHKQSILVDLCIGPFQYPHYPGIYLPKNLVSWEKYKELRGKTFILDTIPFILNYGVRFLQLQMERYGDDERVRGFHLANEWPDRQAVAGEESLRLSVSRKFMLDAVKSLKKSTDKSISLNTNIDAGSRMRLFSNFKDILAILGEQGKLGLDIYPSQETWKKTPLQKIKRLTERYTTSFAWCSNKFYPTEIYFAEVEAQPWGNGQSWYDLIQIESNAQEGVRSYTPDSLNKTWRKHVLGTSCETVSLWGSDFWLSAHEMGIEWPLDVVKALQT